MYKIEGLAALLIIDLLNKERGTSGSYNLSIEHEKFRIWRYDKYFPIFNFLGRFYGKIGAATMQNL